MRWDSGRSLLFYVSLFVLGLIVGHAFEGYSHEAEIYQHQHPDQGWLYWGDISNRWQAIFALTFGIATGALALMLYNVTIQQRDLLKDADKTARAAYDQAVVATNAAKEAAEANRESVDAFINAERGRMVFLTATLDTETKTFRYKLRNIGAGYAIVTRVAYQPTVVTTHGGSLPVPMKSLDHQKVYVTPLAPGEAMRGELTYEVKTDIWGLSSELGRKLDPTQLGTTQALCVQFHVIYKAMERMYLMRTCRIISKEAEGGTDLDVYETDELLTVPYGEN